MTATSRDDALLPDLFLASLEAHGERPAIEVPPGRDRSERICLSYAELGGRARDFAAAMDDSLGASSKPEPIVALMLPRSGPDLVAAQLACGSLGAAWTFLDPQQPDSRLRFIIADTDAELLVCPRSLADRARALGARRLLIAEDLQRTFGALPRRAGARTAAYVIYTSGTTGQPKGVVIEQRGIANLVHSDLETFDLGPEDRIAQGSSAAYDSYVEELWLALSVGATAVIVDEDTLRSGPDLPDFLRRERITVLCPPPTLLRTMSCPDPASALPDLRLLYVGGEALPADLAALWAPGRRLENGYGPTECSVTVMRATIAPEGPITIGGPIRGHRALVLDEDLGQVARGVPGELALAGPGLARGYLNQAELTAEKFPTHPEFGRIYRTGDIVALDEEGRHRYLGRADSQVKIRGHRIELEEIEARLVAETGVREAACRVLRGRIAAYLVANRTLDLEALRDKLDAELPEPMRPASYTILASLPRSTGGKLDRRALPEPQRPKGEAVELNEDRLIALVQDVFRRALDLETAPAADADFFHALGGHSLGAALAVSLLREEGSGRDLAVRDLYEAPTARALARRLEGEPVPDPARAKPIDRGRPGLILMTTIQSLAIAAFLLISSAATATLTRYGLPELPAGDSTLAAAAALALFGLGFEVLWIALTTALLLIAKNILIGRYQAGEAPRFGSFHLRHWLVSSCAALVPFSLLRGTGLDLLLLRRLGARVGRRVLIDRGANLMRGGWDLLEIGDDAVLGRDAEIRPMVIESGRFVLGPISIGRGAVLETRAGMAPGSRLGDGARLAALSLLDRNQELPVGSRAGGVPARPTPGAGPESVDESPRASMTLRAAVLGLRLLVFGLLLLPSLLVVSALTVDSGLSGRDDVDPTRLMDYLREPLAVSVLVAVVVLLLLVDLASRAALCRALGPITVGRHRTPSLTWMRHEVKVGLLEGAGRILSGTLFWPIWLRLAGMRIGRGCEISSIMDVPPELVEIGPESFFADGIYLGGPRHEPGSLEFRATRIASGVFVGNHAVLPSGTELPEGVLLGISTTAPDIGIAIGSSWFGLPPFELPRRERIEIARSLTHEPSLARRITRLFWESLRFILPVPPVLVGLAAFDLLLQAQRDETVWLADLVIAPALVAGSGALLVLLVLIAKWLLLGRMRAGQHALWSCWCSRWDFLYVAWGAWAGPFLRPFEGCPLLILFLRAMGCRIGKGVLLGPGFAQVVDPDMLIIDDDATVEGLFQAHSFEDRVLKLEPLRIGPGAGTGFGSVMLYGAELGEGAQLAPQSVAMKRERLAAGRVHIGAPTRPGRSVDS